MGKLTACDVPMVRVVWVDSDSAGERGWQTIDSVLAQVPGHVETCGFLIQSTKGQNSYIKVALCLDFEEDNLNQYIAIPKKLVKSIHLLTVGKPYEG